eukprot:sb/3469506/
MKSFCYEIAYWIVSSYLLKPFLNTATGYARQQLAYPSDEKSAEDTCLLIFLRGIHDITIKRKLNEMANLDSFNTAIRHAQRLERVATLFPKPTPTPAEEQLPGNTTAFREPQVRSRVRRATSDSTISSYHDHQHSRSRRRYRHHSESDPDRYNRSRHDDSHYHDHHYYRPRSRSPYRSRFSSENSNVYDPDHHHHHHNDHYRHRSHSRERSRSRSRNHDQLQRDHHFR